MKTATEALIHLLHQATHGSLATHSLDTPGYPYLSVLPFVPDTRHCPVFLISGLAEHTRNLAADARASFLVCEPDRTDVQVGGRLTLLGEITPFEPESALIDRYLRYQPTAQRLLQLADFRFARMHPRRLRFIEGFGRMGWFDGGTLLALPELAPATEAALLARLTASVPAGIQLLGIDRCGADLAVAGSRRRVVFPDGPLTEERIAAAASLAIQSQSASTLPADTA